MKLYRVMKLAADGKPLVGTKGYMLGVRPTDANNQDPKRRFDVAAIDATDLVLLGEGLSTSLDPSILKIRHGEALFEIDSGVLGPHLREYPDRSPHCLIEPLAPMPLVDFQRALADTRDRWQRL